MKTTITIKYDQKDFEKIVSIYQSLTIQLRGVAKIKGEWSMEHDFKEVAEDGKV